MASNKRLNISTAFRLNVMLRVGALAITLFCAAWLFGATEFYAIASLISLSCIFQIALLFKYVDRTNRELAAFIVSVTEGDFANLQEVGPTTDSFQTLRSSFGRLADKFSRLRSEREVQAKYLEAVIRHIPVPLISIDAKGNVRLFNNAARRLLAVQELTNIKQYSGFGEDFLDQIQSLGVGRDVIVDADTASGPRKISVRKTLITVEAGTETLISLNDINRALDAAEVDAWRKLTQVLTHEIMNSVTPITSMSETMLSMLEDETSPPDNDDLKKALEIVAERSRGLLKFVQRYREVTRVPVPNREEMSVKNLFETVSRLSEEDDRGSSMRIRQDVEPATLSVHADPELLTQCLLNLVNNAFDAVEGVSQGEVDLTARMDADGRTTISVTDNGCGIPDDQRDRIFIPFYTTKAEGSGIGLSLTRLIIQAHGGNISINSTVGEGTTISLTI